MASTPAESASQGISGLTSTHFDPNNTSTISSPHIATPTLIEMQIMAVHWNTTRYAFRIFTESDWTDAITGNSTAIIGPRISAVNSDPMSDATRYRPIAEAPEMPPTAIWSTCSLKYMPIDLT